MPGMLRVTALACLLLLSGCAPASPDAPLQSYIVQLAPAPLVAYTGGIAGLAATSPAATGAARADLASPASRAYLAYLKAEQAKFLERLAGALGRRVVPDYAYYYALDGLTLRLRPAEAARAAGLPGVVAVRADKANQTLAPPAVR